MTTDNVTIVITADSYPENPRDWDNLGTMAAFHQRYCLGDTDHGIDHRDYSSWDEMENAIIRANPGCVILPLYLYDHSGIRMNTSGFNCPWDSGQVGFIFVSAKKIREYFAIKRVTKKVRERVIASLDGEVETYNQYLCGEVYGYRIEGGKYDGDSCGGFFGSDAFANGMSDHIPKELHELLKDAAANL